MTAYVMVFLSGLSSLVYQILWMQQLGLLFGNTSHAAAVTLAAFFAGLAAGSWFWGRRCDTTSNPLRSYAWLEAGIAVTALLYFVILALFYQIYPAVYQGVNSAGLLLTVKFGLALLLIFPPAFCMGGTIPVMVQYLVRRQSSFGATSALLYCVNTLGAALGALLGGFFLPLWLGFTKTCLGAMLVTGAVAALAFVLSRAPEGAQAGYADTAADGTGQGSVGSSAPARDRWTILLLCFLSGFGMLALEVLWTRMFAQVLENSVYTYSAILVIVLLCLAGGAFISSRLARLGRGTLFLLAVLTLLGGITVALTPFIFMTLTDSMKILVSKGSWGEYLWLIFRNGFLAIGLPALLLGTLFPFLMKAEERHAVCAGRSLGTLAAINTAGAILGSLVCGFVLLGTLGMWRTMQVIAVIYLVAAMAIPMGKGLGVVVLRMIGALFLLLLLTSMNPAQLPVNSIDTLRQQEEILETWESSDCTVAVARDMYGLSIKINSHYGLGSTGAYMQEKLQADVPLMIYPQTESIFFLGMGTGITAGSALDPQFTKVSKVVVCELVPEVITAAEKYITDVDGFDCTGGLFSDPRATVLAEDGRHYLMASDDHFDMVNADLFVPYRSGAGSLYSREHFESVNARLEPGGVFFQWIPLYQVTDNEFSIIARTMLEVFDQVTLWRNNFQVGEEVVVLAGHADGSPLPACDLESAGDKQYAIAGKSHRDLQRLSLPFNAQTILFFYCGNVTAARSLFEDYPVNTDDRPLIEYMAPRSYRNQTETSVPWYVGPRIARRVEEIQRLCPPEGDPMLVNRSAENRRLPAAGAAFHWARIWEVIGDEPKCRQSWQEFLREWTNQ